MDHEPEFPEFPTLPPSHGPAYGEVPPDAPARHVRSRRLAGLAIGTAAALAIGAGGYGIGTAVGSRQDPSTAPSSSVLTRPGTSQQSTDGGSNQPQFGYGGFPGGLSGGTSPYGDGGAQGGTGSSTGSTRTPTASELSGLVRIDTTLGYQDGEAAGTGLVITSDGEVITNHHVVAGATGITVTVMSTGKTYTAKAVGTDASADVAVLQLQNASGMSTVTTDTSTVATGDPVTAVGDAGGSETSFTAAPGTVSAVDRKITTQAEGSAPGESLTGMIEISSDVISGDSGGATYDSAGRVVGMTSAASSGSTDVTGFAIPIARVLSIASDLESDVSSSDYAYGNPAFLGISLGGGPGATVQGVYDGTAAATAGLAAGDTITRVDGSAVATADALERAVGAHSPGDRIAISWTDARGASHSTTVTLGTGPVK